MQARSLSPPTRRAAAAWFLLFASAIRLSASSPPAAQGLALRSLGATNGLAAKVVPALRVDRHGFLWVGSREGLFRYDGYRAVRYLPSADDPRSISDLDIRSIYEDRDGVIWVGTNTGGLNRFDAAAGGFERYRHDSSDPASLSYDSVYGIADGPHGDLWVGSQIGLNRLDRQSGRFTRYLHDPDDPGSLSNDYVFTLLLDRAGALWVATVGGGLNRWEPATATFARFDLPSLTGGPASLNDVFGLAEDDSGTLWVGTRTGLVRIDQERERFEWQDLLADGEQEPLVTSVLLASDGELRLTTIAHGLLGLDVESGAARRHEDAAIAPGVALMSAAESNGATFVGTWGNGVLFGRKPQVRFLWLGAGGAGGLRNENVTAVMATEEAGRPWAGSFGGGPQRADVEAGVAEPLPGETSDLWYEGVQSMARTRHGGLFAGTTKGLWELDSEGRKKRYFEHEADAPGSLGKGYVTALLASEEHGLSPWGDQGGRTLSPRGDQGGETLWVGVGGSGLYLLAADTDRFSAFRHEPGNPASLAGDFITCLLEEAGGYLWVGTRSNGLNRCRVRPWSCERLSARTSGTGSLNQDHITGLFRDSRERLWVGTNSGGLYEALSNAPEDASGFRRWSTRDGLISDSVMALAEDVDGSLWISTREGLTRLNPDSGHVSSFVTETGLVSSHFNSSAAASDSRYLYFGAVGGLLAIPRGQPVPVQAPAAVRITAIDSPEFRQGPTAPAWALTEHTLAHGDPLSIEFATLDFSESLHEYEYRLWSGDPWRRLGPRREVTFFGLAPGRYVFEVRGRDVQGLWSAAPPLRLEIVPPFWKTRWFRGLALFLIALTAFSWHALRLRALEQRNRELTRLKDQREKALTLAQESEAELKTAYEGMSRLARRLESAKEEERQHLSRELHDQLGQSLTAAKIRLQLLRRGARKERTDEELAGTVEMLEDMIRQVRAISLDLRPPLLDEAGLVPALRFYLERLSEGTGLRISADLDPHLPSLPSEVETVLFRVIQEAVNNALRHADARHIHVRLTAEDNSVSAVVEDDGHGFNVLEIQHRIRRGEHLGLLGIRERLRSVRGTIHLESSPDHGTRLGARVAL